MKRPGLPNGSPMPPEMANVMLPMHLPKSPHLPQMPMLQMAPINLRDTMEQIKEMGTGCAMDFKIMIKTPEGAEFYFEGSKDK